MTHQWARADKNKQPFCTMCGLDMNEFHKLGKPECISPKAIQNISDWLDGDYGWTDGLKDLAFRIVTGKDNSPRGNVHIMAKLSIVVMIREKKLRDSVAKDMDEALNIIDILMEGAKPVLRNHKDWRKVKKPQLMDLKESHDTIQRAYNKLMQRWKDGPPPLPNQGDTDGTT